MSSAPKPTAEEAAGSLTGFDEIAIQRSFGGEVATLSATMSMRAIVFAYKLRDNGGDATSAYNEVMKMTLAQVQDFFDLSGVIEGEA